MIQYWPRNLKPQGVMFKIRPMNIRGPVTFSGKRQSVATDAGFWIATISNIRIHRDDEVLEFRALIAALEGTSNELIIGPFDHRRAPVVPGGKGLITDIPYSDGSRHSDGSGFSQSGVKVAASGALGLRATSAQMTIVEAGSIQRGMYFSVMDDTFRPRLHIVTSYPEISGDQVSFDFLPPLRSSVAAGAEIEFGDPKATMSLASADAGEMMLDLGRLAQPSIDLEESWNGL